MSIRLKSKPAWSEEQTRRAATAAFPKRPMMKRHLRKESGMPADLNPAASMKIPEKKDPADVRRLRNTAKGLKRRNAPGFVKIMSAPAVKRQTKEPAVTDRVIRNRPLLRKDTPLRSRAGPSGSKAETMKEKKRRPKTVRRRRSQKSSRPAAHRPETATAREEISESATAREEISESATARGEISESATAREEISESATAREETSESATAREAEGSVTVTDGVPRAVTESVTSAAMTPKTAPRAVIKRCRRLQLFLKIPANSSSRAA